ncbi:MAG: hypothetical protein ACYC90_11825 [Candidatus Nanopelagicales bacterium]
MSARLLALGLGSVVAMNEAWDAWLAKSEAGPVMTTASEAPRPDGPATGSTGTDALRASQVAYGR